MGVYKMPKRAKTAKLGSGDAGPNSKKSKIIKKTKTVIDIDNCPHPFNLSSLAFSTESCQLSRVCNVCHYSWNEVCSNNSPVVLRKETKDGPHVGRRYFQCTDRDCNERFFKWLDKGTRRYSTSILRTCLQHVVKGKNTISQQLPKF